MNPTTRSRAIKLFRYTENASRQAHHAVAIAPPFIYLPLFSRKKISLAAQDVSFENQGAFTGEISPLQLKDLGVRYVIIGHSERRKLGEMDAIINKKIKAALNAGLAVILCVGESKRRGFNDAIRFIKRQLLADLRGISKLKTLNSKLIIAYEPVWAIGTSRFDPPDDAGKVIHSIKNFLNTRYKIQNAKVLYGGSISSKILPRYLHRPSIDGALIGGASLKLKEVKAILKF